MIDMRVRLPDEFRTVSDGEKNSFYERYNEVFGIFENGKRTLQDLMTEMDNSNVETAVIHAEYEFGEAASHLNKMVAQIVEKHPDRFYGFGTVDLTNLNPLSLVEQAEEIADLKLIGINLQPVFFDVDPLNRRLYPLYATAAKLGLIVSFHTGIHFSLKTSIIKNNPLYIDQIAVDFPKLKIIACHAGWPWIPEMVAVARRHKNVYLEFGGIDPKYIGYPGSGWETMFSLMNNLLSNQILFGTDWPVISMKKAIQSWEHLGLNKETLNQLFFENASQLIGKEKGG